MLAQASYPFYDAANPFAYQDTDRVDNASGWVVEPGSVHKGVVLRRLPAERAWSPRARPSRSAPSVTEGRHDLHRHALHVTNTITLPGILAYSSNIGTIAMADKLGAADSSTTTSGRSVWAASPGRTCPASRPVWSSRRPNWSASSYGSIPIGHGVSVTPLQMAGGLRDHRQRRHLRPAAPAQVDDRRRTVRSPPAPAAADPPGHLGRERARAAHHAGGGGRRADATGHSAAVAELPGGRQDRAPAG